MQWKTQGSLELFEAILALENIEEAQNFFRDLLTEQEIVEFSMRLQIAKMLYQGTSYTQIQKDTGVSSTTIARISKWLHKGMNGYKTILNRMHPHTDFSKKSSV
jgi:TrpR-related protein YerC/YecD